MIKASLVITIACVVCAILLLRLSFVVKTLQQTNVPQLHPAYREFKIICVLLTIVIVAEHVIMTILDY